VKNIHILIVVLVIAAAMTIGHHWFGARQDLAQCRAFLEALQ